MGSQTLCFGVSRRSVRNVATARGGSFPKLLRWPKGTVRIPLGDKSAKSEATGFFARFSGPFSSKNVRGIAGQFGRSERNLCPSGLVGGCRSLLRTSPVFFRKIRYSPEQGILKCEQGIILVEQRIYLNNREGDELAVRRRREVRPRGAPPHAPG